MLSSYFCPVFGAAEGGKDKGVHIFEEWGEFIEGY